jgi:hypothetical protein
MIETALFFGLIAGLSSFILFLKLPTRLQEFLIKRPLLTEILTTGLTFITITSVTSSAIGVFTSLISELVFSVFYFIYRKHRGEFFIAKFLNNMMH